MRKLFLLFMVTFSLVFTTTMAITVPGMDGEDPTHVYAHGGALAAHCLFTGNSTDVCHIVGYNITRCAFSRLSTCGYLPI